MNLDGGNSKRTHWVSLFFDGNLVVYFILRFFSNGIYFKRSTKKKNQT